MKLFGGIITLCLVNLVQISLAAKTPTTPCFQYEPAVVKLNGVLVRKTYPGPPNYESISIGDTPEIYWFLQLAKPICVTADTTQPDLNPDYNDVNIIQLVFLGANDYQKYSRFTKGQVIAIGTLLGKQTGHHHTPVLLRINKIDK